MCKCLPNYKWDLTHQKCTHFNCIHNNDCKDYDQNRICRNNKCICSTNKVEDSVTRKCTIKNPKKANTYRETLFELF